MSNDNQGTARPSTAASGVSGAFAGLRRPPQPGDVLDGTYRIDSVLGFGGVGVVCAAWHLHVQRPCAVKFLHPQLVGNPELRARFRREAQSAFQLGHPHIVSITDFRDDPSGWPYIVMELVQGETLRARLDRGPLSPRLAVRLMGDLCDALHTAHRRSVIHRDLKPENLFLTHGDEEQAADESTLFLKVLDFGLSKILDESDITETGRLLGSPSYMSPEQARGDSHLVDARSDIFAVGSLLYECLTGYKLFEAESFEQKRQRIVAGLLPPLRLVQRGMPAELETIIGTACAQKPEDRYQTAAALAEALSRVYPGEDVVPVRRELSGRNAQPLPPPLPPAEAKKPPPLPPAVSETALQPPPEFSPPQAPAPAGQLMPTGQRRLPGARRTGMWVSVIAFGLVLGGGAAIFALRIMSPQRTFGIAEPITGPGGAATRGKAGPAEKGADVSTSPGPAARPAAPKAPVQQRPATSREERDEHPDHAHRAVPKVDQLTIEIVDPVMRRARPAIVRCFPGDVAIPNRVTVDAVIAQSGKVNEATADVPEDQAGCVVDALRALHFPSFNGDDLVSIHYEFLNLHR